MRSVSREADLLTGVSVWTEIQDAARGEGPRRAAIAYLARDGAALLAGFGAGDVVVCNAGEDALRSGVTSPDALQELLRRGVRVLSAEKLHAKVVAFPGRAFVGSANASATAAGSLVEAVVRLDDPALVRKVVEFVDNIRGTIAVDKAYIEWAHTRYWPPRPKKTVAGQGGGSQAAPVSLYVASFESTDALPSAVGDVVRRTRRRMRAQAGPAVDYELHMSWDTDPSWIRAGDWVLWVDVSTEPHEAWPPMQCIGRERASGRSRQIVSWFRLQASVDNQPWDDVRGRVLARTGRRLARDRRLRLADVVDELFDIWQLEGSS